VNHDGNERFRNVVLPHLADAFTLARWLTGNRVDAEDVVQDTCLRAFRAIDTFAGRNARAWVLTIVRHAAYTWLGKNRPAALDVAAARRIDGDAGEAGNQHAGFADPVVDDVDRLGDSHGPVAARIEHGHLALIEGLIVGRLEGAAWRRTIAVVGVVAGRRRDERARQLGRRRRSIQENREQADEYCRWRLTLVMEFPLALVIAGARRQREL
jgi:RNA polymerase sigma factor (sigma-70 family)